MAASGGAGPPLCRLIAVMAVGRGNERVGVLAGDELGVGRKLAGANGELVVPEFLLEPGLVEAHRRLRLQAAHRHQIADVVAR
jgi:hypothetical protein